MIVGERVTGSRGESQVLGEVSEYRVRSQYIIYMHEIVNDYIFSNLVVMHNLAMVKTVKIFQRH